jgi:hypothetical protein
VWADCLAAGIPDALYWELTPPEADALRDAIEKRRVDDRRFSMRLAALGAAATYNVNRAKGQRWIAPDDLIKEEEKSVRVMSAAEMGEVLKEWAAAHNAKLGKGPVS